MEIRSSTGDDASAIKARVDLTLKGSGPLAPKLDEAGDARDPRAAAHAVKTAREAYREQRQERIANARAHYTANHAQGFAQQVASARDVYETRMEKAMERRSENTQPPPSADRADLSPAGRQLASLDALASDDRRAERVSELKALYERGLLPNEDLIARAAYRLLGGE